MTIGRDVYEKRNDANFSEKNHSFPRDCKFAGRQQVHLAYRVSHVTYQQIKCNLHRYKREAQVILTLNKHMHLEAYMPCNYASTPIAIFSI